MMNKLLILIFVVGWGCNNKSDVRQTMPANIGIQYEAHPSYLAAHSSVKSYFIKKSDHQQDEQLDYYLLSIERKSQNNSGNSEDFYYAYTLEKDIYQLKGTDTIRPVMYHLEHGLGGSKRFNVNLAFPKNESESQIFINDKFGNDLQFNFKKSEKSNNI
ncbi:MAG: hypothetical protein WAT92_05875 [Saprospiraceae bacterium]